GIGFRSGVFNQGGIEEAAADAGIKGVKEIADQEVARTFEVGFKSEWFNRRFSLDGSFFHTQDEGMPFFVFVGGVGAQIIINIEESTITGTEGEAKLTLFEGFDAYFSAGYTHSEITEYPVETEFEGNQLPLVPESTLNVGAQYRKEIYRGIGIFTRLDYERRGKQYWNPSNATSRSAVKLLNIRAGFEDIDQKWSLIVEGFNITNEVYNTDYVAGGFAQPSLPDRWMLNLKINF
ncbi:MAG TPA: TonB-dependent receptor, partial [Bacteroidales bacterium]|nr:TonB-dependent receptor [Bacteroidales bacterium]